MQQIIFYGFNKLSLWSRVIIFITFLLIHWFHRNMPLSKIAILIQLLMHIVFGKKKTNSFLFGSNQPFLVICLTMLLVANCRGNYAIVFNHIFNVLLGLVFVSFATNFDISPSVIAPSLIIFFMFRIRLMNSLRLANLCFSLYIWIWFLTVFLMSMTRPSVISTIFDPLLLMKLKLFC